MTTLQAEPALALWRSLAPLARLVVEVVAVSEGPVPQASLLSEAGMLAQRLGRAAGGASSLVQDLRPAERGGLLIFKKELDLTEPGREAIIRALLHEGRYEAVAAAAASLRPAPPSFDWYGWRRLPPGVAPGWHQLGLWMPDEAERLRPDPRYAVRVANRDAPWWIDDDGRYGVNILGVVQVLTK